MRRRVLETRDDRMAFASDAGLGPLSLGSVLAGVLVAYGCFAVLVAVAGGIVAGLGISSLDDVGGSWREQGAIAGLVVAGLQLIAYVAGGYVAGRMARRAGATNGLLVFVFGLVIAIGVGAAIGTQAGTEAIVDELRSVGAPTTWDEWRSVGTIAGVASIAAMLLGAVLGGRLGERWHGKLVTRAQLATMPSREVDLREREAAIDGVGTGDHFDADNVFRHDEIVAGKEHKRSMATTSAGSPSSSRSTTLDEDRMRGQK